MVAINPFKEVPLYGNDYIEAYRRKSVEDPHVYAIADTAIREMIRGDWLHSVKLYSLLLQLIYSPCSAHSDPVLWTNYSLFCGTFCR